MKKLFVTLILVAVFAFGGIVGCVTQTGMKPDVKSMPSMEYTEHDFFDDGKPYFIPIHINVKDPIWIPFQERLTDELLLMHYTTETEVVSFVVNDKELKILSLIYSRAEADSEFYIYDSKPYPVKVTELTMETFVDLQMKQETN